MIIPGREERKGFSRESIHEGAARCFLSLLAAPVEDVSGIKAKRGQLHLTGK